MTNLKYDTATPAEARRTLLGLALGLMLFVLTLSLGTIAYRQAFMATLEYCFRVEVVDGYVCFSHAYRNTHKEQHILDALQAPDPEEELII